MAAVPIENHHDVTLRWGDLDALGHVNQAVYHEMLEEGRGALIAAVGQHFTFVLARVELDYVHEVQRSDGHVTVVSRVDHVGGKSIRLAHEVLLPDGRTAARGISILVAWDAPSRCSRELTGAERAALADRPG